MKKIKEGNKKDLEVINQVLSGDKNAFKHIYNKYKNFIYWKFLGYLNNSDDAKDAMMIAFIKAYENLSKYEHNHTFNAWLTKLAQNVLIDYHRRKDSLTTSIDGEFIFDEEIMEKVSPLTYKLKSDYLNPEEEYISEEKRGIMLTAIESMDNGSKNGRIYKEIITMVYLEEKSYKEVSEITGIKMASLKTNIFRAKAILKKVIEEQFKGEL